MPVYRVLEDRREGVVDPQHDHRRPRQVGKPLPEAVAAAVMTVAGYRIT